jgi:hypothetical protein
MKDVVENARDQIEQKLTELVDHAKQFPDRSVGVYVQQTASKYLEVLHDPHLTPGESKNASEDFLDKINTQHKSFPGVFKFLGATGDQQTDAPNVQNQHLVSDILHTSDDCAEKSGLSRYGRVGGLELVKESLVEAISAGNAKPNSAAPKP